MEQSLTQEDPGVMDYDYDVDGDYYPDFYSDNEVLDDGEESPWDTAEHAPWMTASQMLKDCVVPTIFDGASHMGHVLVWCLVYRLTTQIVQVCADLTLQLV